MAMKDELLRRLGENGWSVTRHSADLEWWVQEIWALESVWAPRGFRLHLTFLTDPQPGSTEPFWALGTCSDRPANRDEAAGEPFLLFREWVDRLPAFLSALDRQRTDFLNRSPKS